MKRSGTVASALGAYAPIQGPAGDSVNRYHEWSVESDSIVCYWSLCVSQTPATFLAVPDACVDVVFDLNDPAAIFLFGPYNRFKKIRFRRSCEYAGIRFRPAMIHKAAQVDLRHLKNRMVRLDAAENRQFSALAAVIGRATNFASASAAIDAWLHQHARETAIHPKGQMAIDHIIASHGAVTLNDAFAEALHVSLRQIRRYIHQLTGFNTKEFSRIVRFQHALSIMEKDSAQLQLELSYFDQSHLIREFKRFTGTTPRRFFNMSVLSN